MTAEEASPESMVDSEISEDGYTDPEQKVIPKPSCGALPLDGDLQDSDLDAQTTTEKTDGGCAGSEDTLNLDFNRTRWCEL